MKVALVHDYLIQDGGAERVLLALHEMYPEAPIFTLFHNPARLHPDFQSCDIRASSLNQLPFAATHYQWYLPFMPQAIDAMDLSGYDLILSSSSSFAKGVLAPPHAIHVCYCHTPTRFLWQERIGYINELPQPKIVKWLLPHLLHRLRQWDRQAADRPDVLLTNSKTSQERIKRYYRRDTQVIHPPVNVAQIPLATGPGNYWLAGGRLVAYKRFDLVVSAFAKLDLPLKIFGEGPEFNKLRRLAGPKTEFLGRIDERAKHELYQHAIAFFYPHVEDFGITAVEAIAAGRPVIAYREGGATETIVDGVSGQFLDAQNSEAIENAVRNFDPTRFVPTQVRQTAEPFAKHLFQERMRLAINEAIEKRQRA